MSLSKTGRVGRDLNVLLSRHGDEVEEFADKVRKNVIVPVCRKHNLGYLAGMGRTIFIGDYEGQEVTVGSAWEAENHHDGRFKFLAKIFTDVLDLEIAHNDCLGYHVDDVVRGSAS